MHPVEAAAALEPALSERLVEPAQAQAVPELEYPELQTLEQAVVVVELPTRQEVRAVLV